VTVHDLRPGPILTEMTAGHAPNRLFATPDHVAAGILAAIDGRWSVRYLPWYWWPIMQIVVRLPEPLFQRFGFLSGR
jgi:decaprenylphospho-beta-D-erythro-pentofuranosid-2-ulose 2-reductase